MLRIAVLLSGRGSNFLAIHDGIDRGAIDARVVCVISNRPGAPGLARAAALGYTTYALDHKKFATRALHEEAVLAALADCTPDFVALAGYMRLLSASFIAHYPNRILNIHPSLLPAFPGVDAQAQAIAHGVRVSGCTVHFVDEHLDAGPIIAQHPVPVFDADNAETLSARILVEEHAAYVAALAKLAGPYQIKGRRVLFSE